MKEYRLLAWPDLPAEYQRTAHRRALSEMSQRFMSLAKLVEVSGLKKSDVRALVDLLDRAWGLEPTSRLSCQAILARQDVTVEIPKYSINHAKEKH